ncbi:MAG: prepilin-type N-terminal cleavage/methylation domain-containing protein [Symploca sp. SIO2E6]|nr:prepilin-type N-terminal cleavage/methylation domain-containing protein [Symploca sp. SIO2E6]
MSTRRQVRRRALLRSNSTSITNSLKTRGANQAGYTLVELLIVLFIVSILSSIAIVIGMGFLQETREKPLLIKAEAYVIEWKENNGYYPYDMNSAASEAGQAPGEPDNRAKWPKDIPSDRVLDYDHWPIGDRCYVQVALRGKNRKPDYQGQISSEISQSGFKKIGRDMVRKIATCQCPCTKQESIQQCREQGKTWEC